MTWIFPPAFKAKKHVSSRFPDDKSKFRIQWRVYWSLTEGIAEAIVSSPPRVSDIHDVEMTPVKFFMVGSRPDNIEWM